MTDELDRAVAVLDRHVPDPTRGLPDPVFYYVSRTTPLINVDLLIKDERDRVLLAWRDDQYAGRGWHLPGGIIRFRETMEQRVRQVMVSEVGREFAFDPAPVAIHELIADRPRNRGHFISILYKCRLSAAFVPDNTGRGPDSPGFLKWHDSCPDDLLEIQGIYRTYI
jgi:colanic acid biosynthesis protein WcaH